MSLCRSSHRLLHHLAKPRVRIPPCQARPWIQKLNRRTLASISQSNVLPGIQAAEVDLKGPRILDDRLQVFSDVSDNYVDVPAIWLRDHCRCSSCFHQITKQRVIETFDDIPPDIAIGPAGLVDADNAYEVTWSDGHKSTYSQQWLAKSAQKKTPRSAERQALTDVTLWSGADIKDSPPTVSYQEVMASDAGLRSWLQNIRRFGFSYVSDCPVTPEATEALLRRIAFVRETQYGGFYDFTADLAKGDTAYTQLGIGAHTDNTYFSDPAGLQMFHLLSHTDGQGGASQLVDGFGAAAELRHQYPEAYEMLSTVPVASHASGGDISLQPWATLPVLVHDPAAGEGLTQVRWNTTDRAAIDAPMERMQAWYDAARIWAGILRKREYWEQLKPGMPLVFDNWRVLHGRSAFTGNRRMCGGYVNRDDYISRYKIVNWGKERCLESVSRG